MFCSGLSDFPGCNASTNRLFGADSDSSIGSFTFGRFVVLIVFQLVVADHYFLIHCPF